MGAMPRRGQGAAEPPRGSRGKLLTTGRCGPVAGGEASALQGAWCTPLLLPPQGPGPPSSAQRPEAEEKHSQGLARFPYGRR